MNTPHPSISGLPPRAGVGLKPQHGDEILASRPELGFFEVHAENYMVAGGPMHEQLGRLCGRDGSGPYALSIHGVGLSIGAEAGLSKDHLQRLRALLDRYQPASFSEHLAWSTHDDAFLNDLLPVPYTAQTLERVCSHVDQVQSTLGRRMLLENPATYVEFAASTWNEADFMAEVIRRTGCGLLLDVNNAYISCVNHGRNIPAYMAALPLAAVGEIHLAGYFPEQDSLGQTLLIDSHGAPVAEAVWSLYARVIEEIGPQPTLIEWDNDVPDWSVLYSEAQRAQSIMDELTVAVPV
ncbi:DUF692 domain-containing protein [Amphibiibacter pelophylacis]|uniref:DUF692 domain-containing protein n=1 Tax=Amphibiibacter pelophylacis TaxID=1799477 RepID=A0ACC6NYH4_9BURK